MSPMATVAVLSAVATTISALGALLLSFLASHRFLNHRFICRLFPLLHLQQRVRHNLQHGVARRPNRWTCRGIIAHHLRTFLQLLGVGVVFQYDSVDSSLA